jgi:hypothetical protein
MTKDEALRLALRTAFQMGQNFWYHADHEFSSHHKKADAIKAKFDELVEETIKQALEQPKPEPVAMVDSDEKASAHMEKALWDFIDIGSMFPRAKPDPRIWPHVMVFAPQHQPLTDVQIATVYWGATGQSLRPQDNVLAHKFARAIEQAHGIGEKK